MNEKFPLLGDNPIQMKTEEQQAFDRLHSLLDQLEFERARNLAESGNYSEAKTILLKLLQAANNPTVMDLLARINAQQGLLNDAHTLWEKALTIDPNNPEYVKGLAYVTSMKGKISNTRLIRKQILIFLGLATLLSLLLVTIFQTGAIRRSINQMAAQSTARVIEGEQSLENGSDPGTINQNILDLLEEIKQDNQTIVQKVDANQETVDSVLSMFTTPVPIDEPTKVPFSLDIKVEGVTLTTTETSVQIRFEERLFLYNDTFTDSGQELLKQLGLQLEPYIGTVQIKVIGYTDSLERDKKNIPLNRGTAVVRYLTENTRLPVIMFTIASGEGLPPPYPVGSTGDPYRERTVVLEIIPLE